MAATGEPELKEIHFFDRQQNDECVVVKGALPKSIKLRFKILCVQQELRMSTVLGKLIEKWIQAEGPVRDSSLDLSDENIEDVKAYVPKSLKLHFKTLCVQKQVKMRYVLYELINEWIEAQ